MRLHETGFLVALTLTGSGLACGDGAGGSQGELFQEAGPEYLVPPDWNARVDDALDPLNVILSANSEVSMMQLSRMLEDGDPPWREVQIGTTIVDGRCINEVRAAVQPGGSYAPQSLSMRPFGCSARLFDVRRGREEQNHFRAWPQDVAGTEGVRQAWFLAVSEEHFCLDGFSPTHCIDPDGFDEGRRDLVSQIMELAAADGMEVHAGGVCPEPTPAEGCLSVLEGLRPFGENQDGVGFDGRVAVIRFALPDVPLPVGSYRDSCVECEIDGPDGALSCQCADVEGVPITSTVDCGGSVDVLNCNGELSCGECQLPPGSYQDSCENCWARSDRLTCGSCERADGTPGGTVGLELPCTGDVTNCDGTLRCGGC